MLKTFKGIILTLLLMTSSVIADNHSKEGTYYWQDAPMICANEQQVLSDLQNQGYFAVNMSLGRENGDPTGTPQFLITYFLNQDMTSTAATITIPTSNDACIVFITHDLTFTAPE